MSVQKISRTMVALMMIKTNQTNKTVLKTLKTNSQTKSYKTKVLLSTKVRECSTEASDCLSVIINFYQCMDFI